MSVFPTAFASLEMDEVLAQWQRMSASTRECLIILAAIALITGATLIWAVFLRKTRRRQHGHHHSPESATEAAVDTSDEPVPGRRRRKWRRPRREHRPRNPTLAETGGLPPVRTGEPPEIRP
jgi:hypothetical protein